MSNVKSSLAEVIAIRTVLHEEMREELKAHKMSLDRRFELSVNNAKNELEAKHKDDIALLKSSHQEWVNNLVVEQKDKIHTLEMAHQDAIHKLVDGQKDSVRNLLSRATRDDKLVTEVKLHLDCAQAYLEGWSFGPSDASEAMQSVLRELKVAQVCVSHLDKPRIAATGPAAE